MTAIHPGTTAPPEALGHRYVAGLEELLRYYEERGLADEALSHAEATYLVALARYRFAPPPGRLIAERCHVMIFGGAGAGKSTLANILMGAGVTDVNAQAGYTRHPIAYFRSDPAPFQELWPPRLGKLERHDSAEAANVDLDMYGWRRLEGDLPDPGFLRRHVVWDCPDLTTKDAVHYQRRVLEIAGLAEVGVYVASDERYNDELPTNFLQAMLDSGKWVVVALTKVNADEADELARLFEQQVASRLRNRDRILAVRTIPAPPPDRFDELWTESFPYGSQLRDALERATGDFAELRRQARLRAGRFLHERQHRMLEPLRRDLGEWRAWAELVRQHANETVLRYEREHLRRIEHRQFRDALDQLKGTLDLSGPLEIVWRALEYARTPYRLLKTLSRRIAPVLTTAAPDDDEALDSLRREMMESLVVTVSTRKSRHPLWRELHDSLENDAPPAIETLYRRARAEQRRDLDSRLSAVTKSIPEAIEKNTVLVSALRILRVLLDIGAVWGALHVTYHYLGGLSLLTIVFLLLFLGLMDDLVEWLCRQYVQRHRDGVLHQQREQVRELIRTTHIDPLVSLPPGKGRRLYALSELAERLPRELAALIRGGEEAA